jgi:hypothetical protein
MRILLAWGESTGGSTSKSTPQLNPTQLLNLYNSNLPTSMQAASSGVAPTNTALAQSAAGANPIYTASGLQQLNQYAPGYQNAGANLSAQQTLSQADLLGGAGGLYALMGSGLTNLLNPAQNASNTQAANLVNSINLNGLSGGEQSAVERSLNQSNYATGNMGLDNATNAVQNAMQFGNALQAKRAALGSALGSASGVASNQNTAFNPISAIGNASNAGNNFGLSQFNPTQANANVTAPLSFASSMFGPLASNASAPITSSSARNQSFNFGCFLTTACCEYKGLPDDCEELTILRQFRDTFVPRELIDIYYKIAPAIVERIKYDKVVLEYIYRTIQDCVEMIKLGYNQLALETYKEMVTKLNQ